jgi:uncharacterized protein YjbI with pentapeptide repeats
MPQCKHYAICGLDANPGEVLCILHSHDPDKNKEKFDKALAAHRAKIEDNFSYFVFPGDANFCDAKFADCAHFRGSIFKKMAKFDGAVFEHEADFVDTVFSGRANFYSAIFSGTADFSGAKLEKEAVFSGAEFKGMAKFTRAAFKNDADFSDARFDNGADFSNAKFDEEADFSDVVFGEQVKFRKAKFSQEANFTCAKFEKEADFCRTQFTQRAGFYRAIFGERVNFLSAEFTMEANFVGARFTAMAQFTEATFKNGANFRGTTFACQAVFRGACFLGRTLFTTQKEKSDALIFSGAKIDFRDVTIVPLDALIFRNAALQRCRFHDTDLRRAEFADVKWPKKGGRFRVYDEDVELQKGKTREWAHVEQLYRQLKQNYEDRRDYAQAGDFHYGEKEMRRRNPHTPSWLRWLLRVYRCVGGYGERCLPPFLWSIGLFVVCALLYLCLGLQPKDLCSTPVLTSVWGYFDYSLRVMTLLKPDDLVPVGCARYVTTFESLLGPILIGLFALALRQRLKR